MKAAAQVAIKRRLAGLTVRAVAKESGLSTGLVLFHFKSKDALIHALLDWLLQENILLAPGPAQRDLDGDCLATLIRNECTRLVKSRQLTELFFEYWVAGTQTPRLRHGMRQALLQYRQHFRTLAARALQQSRSARPGLTAEAVASAAVSFIHGTAIQAMMDPSHFKLTAMFPVIDALAARPASRPRRRSAPAR